MLPCAALLVRTPARSSTAAPGRFLPSRPERSADSPVAGGLSWEIPVRPCGSGRSALSVCLDVEDGLRTPSPLTDALRERFGGPDGIVAFAANATPADFGALAPDVMEFAATGDPNLLELIGGLSRSFIDILARIGWTGDTPVALTGGTAPSYAPYLPAEIRDRLTDPLGSPMDGAIALAREFARKVRP